MSSGVLLSPATPVTSSSQSAATWKACSREARSAGVTAWPSSAASWRGLLLGDVPVDAVAGVHQRVLQLAAGAPGCWPDRSADRRRPAERLGSIDAPFPDRNWRSMSRNSSSSRSGSRSSFRSSAMVSVPLLEVSRPSGESRRLGFRLVIYASRWRRGGAWELAYARLRAVRPWRTPIERTGRDPVQRRRPGAAGRGAGPRSRRPRRVIVGWVAIAVAAVLLALVLALRPRALRHRAARPGLQHARHRPGGRSAARQGRQAAHHHPGPEDLPDLRLARPADGLGGRQSRSSDRAGSRSPAPGSTRARRCCRSRPSSRPVRRPSSRTPRTRP